jgi:hypothetical protein
MAIPAWLLNPALAVPAAALAQSGLSAYGNALAQNELEKSDNRLITEAALAGAGSVVGQIAARRALPWVKQRVAQNMTASDRAAVAAVLARNPEVGQLRALMPALAAVVPSSIGAGFAGGVLAPFIASNLNLMGVQGWSGRQQDYYEQDQPQTVGTV